jgi:hypothetical protein
VYWCGGGGYGLYDVAAVLAPRIWGLDCTVAGGADVLAGIGAVTVTGSGAVCIGGNVEVFEECECAPY